MRLLKFTAFSLLILNSSCAFDTDFNLGSNYHQYGYERNSYIFREGSNRKSGGIVVCGEIVSVNVNNNFILIFRVASERSKAFFDNVEGLWAAQQGVDSNQYWIIDKKHDKVYGPLDLSNYMHTRKTIHIPENLNVHTTGKSR